MLSACFERLANRIFDNFINSFKMLKKYKNREERKDI